jgi:hypothetical protein
VGAADRIAFTAFCIYGWAFEDPFAKKAAH